MPRKVPKYGRKQKHVERDLGIRNYSHDVPLGNTDPTEVLGKLYGPGGSGSNVSSRPRGRARALRGKYT